MDQLYAAGLMAPNRQATRAAPRPTPEQIAQIAEEVVETQTEHGKGGEAMLLQQWNGKLLAEGFGLPEMEIEIERAVEQVERSIVEQKPQGDLEAEKEALRGGIAKKAPEVHVKETRR
jgi:hypothetical protein